MRSAVIFDQEGNQKDTLALKEELYGQTPHLPSVHQYVKAYQSNQRQGTVKKKNRMEVRGGGAKPWRQKGTGRARAGSNTSPLWVGGGRAFPPRPGDYHVEMPRKMKRKALISALSSVASESRVKIIEKVSLEAPSTKSMAELFDKIGVAGSRVLFLSEGQDDNLRRSVRNLKGLVHKRACLVNPYDLLTCDFLVMTRKALDSLTEVFAA